MTNPTETISAEDQKEIERLFLRFQGICKKRNMVVTWEEDDHLSFTITDNTGRVTKHEGLDLLDLIRKTKFTVRIV